MLYRTHDVVAADHGGVITCLGRSDNQVKLRGFLIEAVDIGLFALTVTTHARACAST